MDKSHKLLIISGAITIFGFMICIVGYLLGGRVTGIGLNNMGISVYTMDDLQSNAADNYEEEHIRLDAFSDIALNVSYADIRIEESDHYGLSYKTNINNRLTYETDNNTLTVLQENNYTGTFQWMFFGIDTSAFHSGRKSEYITIYVPAGCKLKDITLRNSSGDISLDNLSAGSVSINATYGTVDMSTVTSASLDIRVETGDICMSDINTGALHIFGSYGDWLMKRITASEETTIKLQTGSLDIVDSSLNDIQVRNSYGDITGDNVSVTNADFSLETGSCRMRDILFDTLSVDSTFGDVDLKTTLPESDCSFDLSTSYGDVYVNNEDMGTKYKFNAPSEQNKSVTISCSSGDINVNTRR